MSDCQGNSTGTQPVAGEESMPLNMAVCMDKMNSNIGVMTVPVDQMRDDMGHLSKNIHDVSSPMKMIPW